MNNKSNIEIFNELEITNSAFNKLNDIINEDNSKLILEIKKSGCYGFTYEIRKIKNPLINENVIFIYKNIELYILKKDINIIKGTKLDYIKDKFSKKFVFINSKLKNVCGCGKSFNIIKY